MPKPKLKVLIVDDEADANEVHSDLLKDSGKVSEVIALSDSHRVESTIQKIHHDVLFLDIQMPGINGISILENIREYNQELPVVYVTAYEKYIPEAIKLNVYSYLLKPVDRSDLDGLLEKLQEKKLKFLSGAGDQSALNGKIKLPIRDGYVYLESDEIFMLEADGNYTSIVTTDERRFLSSYNMGRLAQRVEGKGFLRINRSTILNGKYLVQLNKKTLTCIARIGEKEHQLDISRAFLTGFNREVV